MFLNNVFCSIEEERMLSNYEEFYPPGTKIVSSDENSDTLHLKTKNKDEFLEWLEEFKQKSYIVFRVCYTRRREGVKVEYYAVYRCQHDTRPRRGTQPSKQHTGCKASLHVKIFTINEKRRGALVYQNEFPTVVKLEKNHNHTFHSAEALTYRDVHLDVQEKFITMFEHGISPRMALHMHQNDMLDKYGEEYSKISGDRSLCPDSRWVYYFFEKNFPKDFGKFDDVRSEMKHATSNINCKSTYKFLGNNFIIALCTPLMERVHELENSKKVIFVDSSGNMDRYDSRVFFLMTETNIGCLPLGVLISSSISRFILNEGFKLLRDNVLPFDSFCYSGCPENIIFDYGIEQDVLQTIFPSSRCSLPSSCFLKYTWKWLWEWKQDTHDRQLIFEIFENVLNCSSNLDLENVLKNIKQNRFVESNLDLNSLLDNLFDNLFDKKHLWCHKYNRRSNNVVEATLRCLMDRVPSIRAYNLPQLLYTISNYYTGKLTDMINEKMLQAFNEDKFNDLDVIKILDEDLINNLIITTEEEVKFESNDENEMEQQLLCSEENSLIFSEIEDTFMDETVSQLESGIEIIVVDDQYDADVVGHNITKKLKSCFEIISNVLHNTKKSESAVNAFYSACLKIKTESEMQSSLHSFEKITHKNPKKKNG